jgi:hypothetical protein
MMSPPRSLPWCAAGADLSRCGRSFGVHGASELCYLVGLYCLVSVTLNGFDVPVPEPEEGAV